MTADSGITIAVHHVDRHGTHVIKPRVQYAGSVTLPWPFGDGHTSPDPPCKCSPNCRYPDPDKPPRAIP
jgi:hypothetical protein